MSGPHFLAGDLSLEDAPVLETRLRIRVVGPAGLDLLPGALRALANLGHSPLGARVQPGADGTAALWLELPPQGTAAAERIARILSQLPAVRQVAYKEAGSGGLFRQAGEAHSVAAE